MDKGISIGLSAFGAEVLAFAGAAVLAAALRVPGVVAAVVEQVALCVVESRADAVLAVGQLGTIERPTAHLSGEVSAGDAEDLLGHHVVDTFLQIGYLLFESCKQALDNLTQKDSTLAARV